MAKGRKTGGRKKGVPNHVTTGMRRRFLETFERLEGEVEKMIRATADGPQVPATLNGEPVKDKDGNPVMVTGKPDPAKAAELIIRMAEFALPKLARQELTGPDGGPITVVVQTLAPDKTQEE